jgi:hypothetical protein
VKSSCPGCGESVDLEGRSVQLWSGSCPSCQRELSLLEGAALDSDRPALAEGTAGPAAAAVSGGPAIPCPDCAGVLALRPAPAGGLHAVCGSCEAEFDFRIQSPEEDMPSPRGEGGRGPPRRFDREEGGDRPPSRPCRECGGPLRFSTGPDGRVTGECSSCGNRFTLPPREDRGRFGRGRPGGGSSDRRFTRQLGGPRTYAGRGPPRRGGFDRGPPRGRDRDAAPDDRRRRPRRRSDREDGE